MKGLQYVGEYYGLRDYVGEYYEGYLGGFHAGVLWGLVRGIPGV